MLKLVVIADDFTGATDIASMLVRAGQRVIQTIGVPSVKLLRELSVDAVVVALKTRSLPPDRAVALSCRAVEQLRPLRPRQFYFKYCSTFDSTPRGNIGPVSDALLERLDCRQICHLPSFPENGRTVYQGYLFVGDQLLHESGMAEHPLNPMSDAQLQRWLGLQTPHPVGKVTLPTVRAGSEAVRRALAELGKRGVVHVIGDALDDEQLRVWAEALRDAPLIAGGSALATPLARMWPRSAAETVGLLPLRGQPLLLAGSCSRMTRLQIDSFRERGGLCLRLDPVYLLERPNYVEQFAPRVQQQLASAPVLVYSSEDSEQVRSSVQRWGSSVGPLIERSFGQLAQRVLANGSSNSLVVAGGETSGAVVSALGVAALAIGGEIAPGVPWTKALDVQGRAVANLALKSGNFGDADFFRRALEGLCDAKCGS